MKKIILGAVTAAALVAPAAAGAHATVNAMQPQGKSLTSARQAYVVRVPNERADSDTYRVSLFVPPAIQGSIRAKKLPGWTVRLSTKDSGVKDAEGAPILNVLKITWTAKDVEASIPPLFYEEFPVRWQNPAQPQKMCFWIHQFYGLPKGTSWSRMETVKWTGAEGAATPASCLSYVAS
jgi:uncharacterized protein YcnI